MGATTSPASLKLDPVGKESWFATGPAIVLYLAAVRFLLYLFAAGHYGYFRDELYYLACAEF